MLIETNKSTGFWPTTLNQKDWDLIIQLSARSEIENHYNCEIHKLCKTSCFGAINKKAPVGTVDKGPINEVVEKAKSKAPMISSMVFGVGLSSRNLPSHLMTMKLIAILVILCRSAYRNNGNYILLLIGLYFHSAGARTNAITLLDHFGLSVSYDVLQRKLRDITFMSKNWIKQ